MLFIIPCVLQVFENYLEYRRTGVKHKLWLGALGFALIALGMAFLIGSLAGYASEPNQLFYLRSARFLFDAGILLWFLDQLSWLRRRVKVGRVDNQTGQARQ